MTNYQKAIQAAQRAATAIKAAKMRHRVGRLPSTLYATNRGVSMRVYRLACQLEAVQRAATTSSGQSEE